MLLLCVKYCSDANKIAKIKILIENLNYSVFFISFL